MTISGVISVDEGERVGRPRTPSPPARDAEGESDAEGNGDRDGEPGQLEALIEGRAQIGVVPDGALGIVPVPTERPALGGGARASLVEGEADGDQHGTIDQVM